MIVFEISPKVWNLLILIEYFVTFDETKVVVRNINYFLQKQIQRQNLMVK